MDLGEVDILYVVCGVVVAYLAACPVYAFDLDGLVGLNGAVRRVVRVPAVLEIRSTLIGKKDLFGRVDHAYVEAVLLCCWFVERHLRCVAESFFTHLEVRV
jgi:hypothetical protein